MSSLRNKYSGRPAAILGGGPSLPEDMKRLPRDCVLITVNHHGFYYCDPQFMVYNDTPGENSLLSKAVQEHKAIRISPEPTSDVLFDIPDIWTGFFSSNTAAWFALWIGCDPVILCGMDCYQGEQKHCPPIEDDSPAFHHPLDFYLRPWAEDCRNSVLHPERLRAVSGPLTQLFGTYQ